MRMIGAVVVAAGLATAGVQAQQQLQVFASVIDGAGGDLQSLVPGDVELTEGGMALKIAKIEPIVGWPTRLQVLIDNGAGIGSENLTHLRNGLRGMLTALPDGIEVSVFTIAPQARTLIKATTDKAAMLKGVDLLSPDAGAGRFVESLNEALQRVERDKSDHFPMLVIIGSAAGDTNVMERDLERIQKRLIGKPTTVHVAILNSVGRTASMGAMQGEVGMFVTKMTGGRFESIAAASRLATLMPEFGELVAASHERQSRQFRITADRPAAGPVGTVSIASRGGLKVTGLSFDGRHP